MIEEKLDYQKIENLKATLQVNCQERRKIRLLDDNERTHTAKVTRKKLEELGREVLPRPLYLPDLDHFGYQLFHSLRSHLVTKRFDDEADLKSELEVFFSSLSKKFFEDGIVGLSNRREYVVNNNGVYVID